MSFGGPVGTLRGAELVTMITKSNDAPSAAQRLDTIIAQLESYANRADRIRRGIIGLEPNNKDPNNKDPDTPQPVAFSMSDKLQVIDRLLDQLRVDLEVIESRLGFG